MATQTVVSSATRHVLRDVIVLAASVALTAGTVAGLSVLVGQWA